MSNHAHEYNVAIEELVDDFHEPKHRGMSDEEFAAENWRRLEMAIRR